MKVTADTNLIVRVVVRDDEAQASKALDILSAAEAVILSLPCLCEFVWVLGSVYQLSRAEIGAAVRAMARRANVLTDETAVTTGLLVLEAGGDFADGGIAAAGVAVGGDTFVSFDRQAVSRIQTIGMSAQDAATLA